MVVRNLCFRRGVHLKVHRQFDRLVRFGVVCKRVGQDSRVRVREVGARTEDMVAEPGARLGFRDSYLAGKTIISSQPAVLCAPWKGASSQWVRIPPNPCRFGWKQSGRFTEVTM